MKRTLSLLAALLILAMALVPLGGLAAPTDTLVLQLSNLVLTSDGATVSLDSPTLQIALAESSDGSVGQLILDLLNGNENITSAMLQADEGSLLFKMGGMDNAYAVNLAELPTALAGDFADLDLENWTLPQELLNLLATGWQENFQAGDPIVAEGENGISMTYVTYTGDVCPTIRKLFQLLRDDPVVNALAAQSEGDFDFATLMDEAIAIIDEGIITSDCTYTVGTDDSGSIVDQDSTSVITINDPESPELSATFTTESKMDLDFSDPDNGQVRYIYDVTGEGVSLNYRLEGALSGLESGNLGLDFAGKFSADLDGESAAGEFTFTYSDGKFALNITGDGESDVPNQSITGEFREGHGEVHLQTAFPTDPASSQTNLETLNFAYDKIESDDGVRYEASFRYADDGSEEDFSLRAWMEKRMDGSVEIALSMEDAVNPEENMLLSLAYVPGETAEGDLFDGALVLTASDETGPTTISVDVRGFTTLFDTDSLYIDPATAVDVLTMTDDDLQLMSQQFSGAVINVMQKLSQAYPMLFGDMTSEY
ncbi:MAG: hypothetical protein Q4C31_06090 [Eubacteriales bacterium]|nr:hypothetical protein [Eubacteriales bacterium]